jgi:hypothetical protein
MGDTAGVWRGEISSGEMVIFSRTDGMALPLFDIRWVDDSLLGCVEIQRSSRSRMDGILTRGEKEREH